MKLITSYGLHGIPGVCDSMEKNGAWRFWRLYIAPDGGFRAGQPLTCSVTWSFSCAPPISPARIIYTHFSCALCTLRIL